MSAIGPGDWVECDPPAGRRGEVPRSAVSIKGSYPERGGIYQVREVGVYRTSAGLEDGLRLVGIVAAIPNHPDRWWPTCCFRPIYRPKADLIESLKTPAKRERSPAHA